MTVKILSDIQQRQNQITNMLDVFWLSNDILNVYKSFKLNFDLYEKTWLLGDLQTNLSDEIQTNSNWLSSFLASDFDDSFTNKDKIVDILNNVVYKTDMSNDLKIYRYIDKNEDYKNKNYELLNLYKKETYIKWELQTVEYFASFDWTDFSDLVIKESYLYDKDTYWYTKVETINIDRYNEDETVWWTKTLQTIYDTIKALNKWYRRRVRIIDDVKADTVKYVAYTMSKPVNEAELEAMWLLWDYATEIVLYKEWDRQPLIDVITNDTKYTWLDNIVSWDTTIRMIILDDLTY